MCQSRGGAHKGFVKALLRLAEALRLLGMEPMLETREIAPRAFTGMTSNSNRIWIAGHPIEDWLNVRGVARACCSASERGMPDIRSRQRHLCSYFRRTDFQGCPARGVAGAGQRLRPVR